MVTCDPERQIQGFSKRWTQFDTTISLKIGFTCKQKITLDKVLHPQHSFNSQWDHVHMSECFCTKCVPFCFYKITVNTSTAIRMCSREGRIPTLELPKTLNCNENLDSLASQVILNYYLNSVWGSASSQGKKSYRKLRQETSMCYIS